MVLLAGAACKREGGKPAAQVRASSHRPAGMPREVIAYVGLRNPQSGLDDLLGILREFVPVPFDRDGLLDLLAQRGHLPRELLATIDTAGTFWLVMLDGRQLPGERDPGLLVFPLRSRKQLEAALEKRMQRAGKDGDLTRYTPRPGQVGLTELRLLITDRNLIVPSGRKALELCLPFVERNLIDHPPSYDLAVHVMTENLSRDPKHDLQKQIDRALDRVRANVPPPAQSDGIDHGSVASTAEETIRYYGQVLKSTREVLITADVDPGQITLAVRAEARSGGLLQKIIQRQRPGTVFGKELLPRTSWLVLSNRGNPEAAAERQKTWAAAVRGALRKLDASQAARLSSPLIELGQRFTGDASIALHRAPSGVGLTLSAVARVKGARETREALDQLATAAVDWARQQMRKERDPTLRELKLERKEISTHGAVGSMCKLGLHYPEARREELTRLFGTRVGFGWALQGEHALFAAGKEAEEQLTLLAKAARSGKLEDGLDATPAFRRADAAPSRIGLLYLSLLDLARWFEGSGIKDAEAVAGALKATAVKSAPSIDWGVNAARTQLDITVRLPVEHFRAFKPILDELLKRRSASSAGGAAWPKPERESPP